MKKNNAVIIVVVIVAVVVLALVMRAVNRRIGQRIGEGMVKKMIEKGTGGRVNIDAERGGIQVTNKEGTFKFSQQTSWPTDLPAGIPLFKYGQVKGVARTSTESNQNWTVTLEKVDKDAYDKYKKDLKSRGWEISVVETPQGSSIQGQKDTWMIFTIIDQKGQSASWSLTKSN